MQIYIYKEVYVAVQFKCRVAVRAKTGTEAATNGIHSSIYTCNVFFSLGLTHRYPREDKQGDAGGHPEQAVAQSAQQQTGQQRVPPSHHVAPAALPITHTGNDAQVLNRVF